VYHIMEKGFSTLYEKRDERKMGTYIEGGIYKRCNKNMYYV